METIEPTEFYTATDFIKEVNDGLGYTRADCVEMYRDHVKKTFNRQINLGAMFPGICLRPVQPGSMCTIIATTGTSKTWLLLHLMHHFPHLKIVIFELELTCNQLIERDLAILNRCSPTDIYNAFKNKNGQIKDFNVDDNNIRMFDTGNLTVELMENKIHQINQKYGQTDIVMVDYMGLISGQQARYIRATENAQKLKRMAKNTRTALINVSQIARKDDDKCRPVMLFDAKDSGDIENSSSIVIGMWPQRIEHNGREIPSETHRWIQVLKSNDTGASPEPLLFRFNWNNSTFSKTDPSVPQETDWADF